MANGWRNERGHHTENPFEDAARGLNKEAKESKESKPSYYETNDKQNDERGGGRDSRQR